MSKPTVIRTSSSNHPFAVEEMTVAPVAVNHHDVAPAALVVTLSTASTAGRMRFPHKQA
jgi:hypothetical protein